MLPAVTPLIRMSTPVCSCEISGNSAIPSTNNVDSISGFVPGSDTIELENSIFSGIGGSLSAAEFRAAAGATTATTAGQRIIYNTTTGDLYWDADGNAGGSAPVRFANLTNPDGSHPTLVNTNFILL